MLRTITYALYPSPGQENRLFHFLHVGRRLYNHALEQRIRYYKETAKSLTNYDQNRDLTNLRAVSKVLADVPSQVERDALRRLDKAFANFFRRIKEGNDKPGFPRFKGSNRWQSFSIFEPGKVVVGTNRIRIRGISGQVVARNVRKPEGKIKQQRIVLRAGRWFCQLVVDDGRESPQIVPVKSAIGIDMGLKSFAVLSTGEDIPNPRFGRNMERKLARCQRSVSRKNMGSNNRRKAVRQLQRIHLRISDQRWNFTHHLSKRLVAAHQLIAVEKLSILGMVNSGFRLGKSILDAAWGQLLFQLGYKAEEAGCLKVEVEPAGTSQDCSQCGERVQKDLSVRVHRCQHCGLVLNRDVNAAKNILARAIRSAPAGGIPVSKASGSATEPKRRKKSLIASQS